MTRADAARRYVPSELRDRFEERDVLKRAYYEELLRRPEFLTAADALPAQLDLTEDAVRAAVQPFLGSGLRFFDKQVTGALHRIVTERTAKVAHDFATRWAFPDCVVGEFMDRGFPAYEDYPGSSSWPDVADAFLVWRLDGSHGPPLAALPIIAELNRATRDQLPERWPDDYVEPEMITAHIPPLDDPETDDRGLALRFSYSPYVMTEKQAKEYVEEIISQIREEAASEIENATRRFQRDGLHPLHPRDMSADRLALGARARWYWLTARPPVRSWAKINRLESRPSADRGIQQTFHRWCRVLGPSTPPPPDQGLKKIVR